MQFRSSHRWMKFPAPRVTLMCVQLRERDTALGDSQTLLHSTHQGTEPHCVCGDCPEAPSLVSHHSLSYPVSASSELLAPLLILILSWSSGLFIYLACDEQLSLSNSSLNLAQPVPPAPTEPRHSQKSNPASCTVWSLGHILYVSWDGMQDLS